MCVCERERERERERGSIYRVRGDKGRVKVWKRKFTKWYICCIRSLIQQMYDFVNGSWAPDCI